MNRLLRVLAVLMALVVLLPVPEGLAEVRVTLGLGKIEVNSLLAPGQTYRLPEIPISNTGTEEATFEISFASVKGQSDELAPEAKWFVFRPATVKLRPGETQKIQAEVRLPWLVPTGRYFGLIQIVPATPAEGTRLVAGVGAKVWFAVQHGNPVEAGVLGILASLRATAPWSYLALALAALVLGYPWWSRRLGIQLAVHKRE